MSMTLTFRICIHLLTKTMQSADWMDQQKLSLLKYMNYWLRDRVSWLMLCKTWMAGILDPNNNILFPPFTSSFFFWVFCVHYLWVLFKKMNISVTSLPYCVNLYILTWSFKVFQSTWSADSIFCSVSG